MMNVLLPTLNIVDDKILITNYTTFILELKGTDK